MCARVVLPHWRGPVRATAGWTENALMDARASGGAIDDHMPRTGLKIALRAEGPLNYEDNCLIHRDILLSSQRWNAVKPGFETGACYFLKIRTSNEDFQEVITHKVRCQAREPHRLLRGTRSGGVRRRGGVRPDPSTTAGGGSSCCTGIGWRARSAAGTPDDFNIAGAAVVYPVDCTRACIALELCPEATGGRKGALPREACPRCLPRAVRLHCRGAGLRGLRTDAMMQGSRDGPGLSRCGSGRRSRRWSARTGLAHW